MRTYVAEINGEAIVAFRAEDDDQAYDIVNNVEGGIQISLLDFDRADGDVLWDGATEIVARRATVIEHAKWLRALKQSTREAAESGFIDRGMRDDPDDFCLYLIPIPTPADDGQEDQEYVPPMGTRH